MADQRRDNNDHGEIEEENESIHRLKVPECGKQGEEKKPKSKLFSQRFLPLIGKHGESSKLPKPTKSHQTDSKVKSLCYKGFASVDSSYTSCSSHHAEKKTLKTAKHNSKEFEVDIIDYLDRNQDFLETYILKTVSVNQLESWLDQKKARNLRNTTNIGDESINHRQSSIDFFTNIETKLKQSSCEHFTIIELAVYITQSVGVDAYRIFKLDSENTSSVQVFVTDSPKTLLTSNELAKAEDTNIEFVWNVANKMKCLRLSRENDAALPNIPSSLLNAFSIKNVEVANYLLYQPILTSGKTTYVIEMWRVKNNFNYKDEKICNNIVTSFHYCNLYVAKEREGNMSNFLLDVVKAIFEEMVSLDQLIKSILKSAQRLVNADRASLFLVDNNNSELVSTVFDLKFDHGQDRDMEKTIRMPITRGIAGCVASSGETMNIPDAYSDPRFNREVDEVTGYKTISILCMPIKVRGKIIGVVQMVNKLNNYNFDHEDEIAFEKFSTFFGLALHNARLYDKIIRKEQRYKVALEILSYHNTCKEHEVQEVQNDSMNETMPVNINDFYLDPYELDDLQKCKAAIKMFDNLFELSKFDSMAVTRFILTVKKNYRKVPYHNFDHGWSVAHAMYVILKKDHQQRFNYKMKLALFVACLCHDLDHRGYTNKYMNETASPLAAMYTTSPLEHHHFNITVTILQQDGHNIFSHLSSEDYKDILRYIRHCILATDLAAFFPNLAKLKEIYSGNSQYQTFDWGVPNHRDLAMALSMTAADLSASAKPWEIQIKTVKVIFEEFYGQGDKERAAGKTPIPMMDRRKPEEQPASQVGFLSQICIPCYSMLYKILPQTEPMYVMALQNLNNWKSKANALPGVLEKADT